MAEMKLFNRQEVLIRTIEEDYLDDDNNWQNGATVEVPIECNIQPYREGKNAFNQPAGFRTINAIKVYTPSEIVAADEDDNIKGDQIVYNGKTFFCKDLEIWEPQTFSGRGLIPQHYLGYFYRKDKS